MLRTKIEWKKLTKKKQQTKPTKEHLNVRSSEEEKNTDFQCEWEEKKTKQTIESTFLMAYKTNVKQKKTRKMLF